MARHASHTHSLRFRLTASLVAIGLLIAPGTIPVAAAQGEAPSQAGDPPGRVGRVARLSGSVSFHTVDQTQWEPAALNYPVTSGNSFWTEPRAGAELEVAAVRVVMDQSTQFDIDQIGDHDFTATVAQGTIYLAARGLLPGDRFQIRTPRGVVTIAQQGQYEIAAGDTERPTTVSVTAGEAQVSGDNVSMVVGPNQTGRITGTSPLQGSVGTLAASPFLSSHSAPIRAMPTGDYAPPPVVQQMTGGEALIDSGRWERNTEYGQVWYPPVERGWVPYRYGHWAFVQPWGWTWVDDASWGFAPFHYGRWVQIGPSWGWLPIVPGVSFGFRPVYAPALVAFIGIGAGFAIGAAFGRSVGWTPLGPREVYYPPYGHSQTYIRNVNVTNVTNVTNITNITNNAPRPATPLVNRGATTVVPATAMTGSQGVASRVQPVPAQALAQIQPVRGPAVQPTATTAGVTPAVARQLNLAPATAGAPAPRPAPGPALQAQPAAGAAVPLRTPSGVSATPLAPSAAPAPAITGQGGPGQPPRPAAPIAVAPTTGPSAAGPSAATARPAPTIGAPGPAPGPAIVPRASVAPGAISAAPLPQLRPTAPSPAPSSGAGMSAPPIGRAATPGVGAPVPQGAGPATPGLSAAPQPARPGPQPGLQQVTPGAPALRQATPTPAPQVQRAAPAPQVQQPSPQIQRAVPAPQVQQPSPQIQRAAPAPQFQQPAPVQRQAPTPQVQQYAPPPAQRASPPPMQHSAPPPMQRAAPPVQQYSPPPAQHSAPAPAPAPRQAPAPQRTCPPGRPSC